MGAKKRTGDTKWPRKPRKIEKSWTPSDIQKIIELVEDRKLLWDSSQAEYKDSKAREKSFQEVAYVLGRTVTDCKAKWDNLRAQFRSYQVKEEQNIPIKWQYFDSIQFLSRVCESRKLKFNSVILPATAHHDQFLEDAESSFCSDSMSSQEPIKEEEDEMLIEDNNDTNYNDTSIKETSVNEQTTNSAQIFGDFVADQIRQLKPHISDELKKNILKLIIEALEKNT